MDVHWDSIFQYTPDPDWDSIVRFTPDPDDGIVSGGVQLPSPPDSQECSPVSEGTDTVSISTTFYPRSEDFNFRHDDVLRSSDAILFYVHSPVLQSASDNCFHSLLPLKSASHLAQNPIIEVPDSSDILNIILHIIYDLSCASYLPAFKTLERAVSRLPFYGIQPRLCITSSTLFYSHLLSHAYTVPLDLYTLAAEFDLYDLAVAASPYLLSVSLNKLSEEAMQRMGAIYLKRLLFLQYGRIDALKRILLGMPCPHASTRHCGVNEQANTARAWSLATAYLTWDARPDLPTSTIGSTLNPLADQVSCEACQKSVRDCIHRLVTEWSVVKRTI